MRESSRAQYSSVVSEKLIEVQPQILRLTTPKLETFGGPVRSG